MVLRTVKTPIEFEQSSSRMKASGAKPHIEKLSETCVIKHGLPSHVHFIHSHPVSSHDLPLKMHKFIRLRHTKDECRRHQMFHNRALHGLAFELKNAAAGERKVVFGMTKLRRLPLMTTCTKFRHLNEEILNISDAYSKRIDRNSLTCGILLVYATMQKKRGTIILEPPGGSNNWLPEGFIDRSPKLRYTSCILAEPVVKSKSKEFVTPFL
ncbi:uncharacterized protein RAG0_11067 [Rhynchosporium agropyri]|uniref:Uncharacterized protein n=1 Tax=Rhynchosporium agropyri TaxID=914238 RepID=A0A1E1L2H7_9HELO|nr:uncharacterized protein RAG0_11067 [Rhynchosporium agropyri]